MQYAAAVFRWSVWERRVQYVDDDMQVVEVLYL